MSTPYVSRFVSTGQLLAWAEREVRQRTGYPRAYTGPYPDRRGPTMVHADIVADMADALQEGAIGHTAAKRLAEAGAI